VNIFVVGCRHRSPLIVPHLQAAGVPYISYCTPDYELPEGFQPQKEYRRLVFNQRNHMRCCYGHRDVMRMMPSGETALILEDDAIPNTPAWLDIAHTAEELLDQYNIVSLHTRGMEPNVWLRVKWKHNLEVWVRDGGWAVGSLAYLIREDAARAHMQRVYDGLPMDLCMLEMAAGKFAAIMPSPFDHGVTGDDSLMMHSKEDEVRYG
jgi:hypothetical protein